MSVQTPHPVHRIELRLKELAQLFNSMDPTPFHHKDLDPDAEAFIKSWAMEYPAGSRLQLTVHLEQMPEGEDATALVTEAIHNFFGYEADLAKRDLRRLLREGRMALVIGLAFVAACLLGAEALARAGEGTFFAIVRESLTIGGWVAMWRPLQIFLYDWWPLARRQRTWTSLAHAQVRVLPAHHLARPQSGS